MKKELKKELFPIILSGILAVIVYIVIKITDLPQLAQIIMWAVVYLIAGFDVLKSAFMNLISGNLLDEEFLMAVASIGAFAIGEYHEGVCVMIFYSVGELCQDMAVSKSRKRISAISKMRQTMARVVTKGEDGAETILQKKPKELAVNEILRILPGETVPTDGEIVYGTTTVDNSSLTGESMPIERAVGDEVFGGTINQSGAVDIRVTKPFSESKGEKIIELIENSTLNKSKTEKFITKFANIYTPVVVGVAVLLAIIPSIITGDWQAWIKSACVFLVVSCPCAIVISVPMAFFAGVGTASKNGLLVKGCDYLEALAKTKSVVLDKTGTVTDGKFSVVSFDPENNGDENELLAASFAGASLSNHPISEAIARYAEEKGVQKPIANNFREITGQGVAYEVLGDEYLLGRDANHKNGTYIFKNGEPLGVFVLADKIKADSQSAISEIRKAGANYVAILSGDKKEIVSEVAGKIGADNCFFELLPEEKVENLSKIIEKTNGTTVYCGDGINDAPVLALADVGVAMGGVGQDAAVEAADCVLMNDSLATLAKGVKIAQKTIKIARENIVFALSVKLLVLVLSIFGISIMWLAVFADVGVCLIAILNSLRILSYKG